MIFQQVECVKLTDAKILDLSQRINKELDLRKLATPGLQMQEYAVSAYLKYHRESTTLATHDFLIDWRKSQPNPYIAYVKLCEALVAANMRLFIEETLR